MRKVTPHIYQGDYHDAVNYPGLAGAGVTAVLNVAAEANYEIFQKGYEHARIPMVDDPRNPMGIVRGAATVLEMLLRQNHVVLVHCMVGRSRSAAVVLAWLIEFKAMRYEEAMDYLTRRLPQAQINPCHLLELRSP